MKYTEREAVMLAALLHDIGKLMQRAKEELKPEYKNLEGTYCPKNKYGRYTHSHLLYSAQFVKYFLRNDLVEGLVLGHHLPDRYTKNTRIAKIITLADRLSSSEREENYEDSATSKLSYKKTPLLWPFTAIKPEEVSSFKYCKIQPMDYNMDVFIPLDTPSEGASSILYDNILGKFKNDINNLNFPSDFYLQMEILLSILEKFTIFIPSSTIDKPTISLFHHLKTTAAIACCLYDIQIDEKELTDVLEYAIDNNSFPERENKFVIIKGDVSGIQDFIYSIVSKGALRQLRSRAIYIQLLSEISARFVLNELNLPLCNLLYCGGGNFMILGPNSEGLKNKLENVNTSIDSVLFNAHRGKLGLVLSSYAFSYDKFHYDKFKSLLEESGLTLAKKKRKKFSSILEKIFIPEDVSADKKCKICGAEITYDREICEFCESFRDLSREFINAKYLKIKNATPSKIDKFKNWKEVFTAVGFEVEFEKDPSLHSYVLNSSDLVKHRTIGFKFEANYIPRLETLEDIAGKSTKEIGKEKFGVRRWGVLRMDVDNLGKIFSEWINKPTISKYSFISYMLNLFFQSGINQIVESKYANCMVVYAGGDDLCIIGPWNDLPLLALEIRNEFNKFVSNPSITISGGIYISPSEKFPVYQAAREAGEMENKAKEGGKDRVVFLSDEEVLTWKELEKIINVKDKLVGVLLRNNKEERVPRSLLSVLYAGYEEEELVKKGKIPYPRIWRIFYAIKRFMIRHKKAVKDLNEIREKFISDFEMQPKLNIAVRWAELETRKGKGG